MADEYGSDFMTIVDEDGTEYELEVIPAGSDTEDSDLEVSILKSVEEDGEPILCAIEDDAELEAVYQLIMDQLYEEDTESEE